MLADTKDSPLELNVFGPRWKPGAALWTAKVRVLSHRIDTTGDAFEFLRASRPVFVPRSSSPQLNHFPNTLLAECRVTRVCLKFGDAPQVCKSTTQEVVTTLLLGVDLAEWETHGKFARLRNAICLAGEFDLRNFFPQAAPPAPLKKMLEGIVKPTDVVELRAMSSGLGFTGAVRMPEGSSVETAAYLVEVALPPPIPDTNGDLSVNSNGTVLVRLDRERLEAFSTGQRSIQTHFADLVSRLNPVDPPSRKPLLRWTRLDLADPTRIPEFHWRIDPAATQPVFEFASGAWRLSLADQPANMEDIVPRAALTCSPNVKIIKVGAAIEIKVAPEQAEANSMWNAFGAIRPEAEYRAEFVPPNTWNESISIRRVSLGYDAVEVAGRVRAQYGLPLPRTDDFEQATSSDLLAGATRLAGFSDGKVDPSVLWAFAPLEDGWAQLPFLNLTEQLFVDSLPAPEQTLQLQPATELLRGALMLGNDGIPPVRRPGEVPWNLTLADAQNYSGTWTLTNGRLSGVTLRFDDPILSAEGLLWLATETPSASDALPTNDNWLGSLRQIPLRTPRRQPRLDIQGKPVLDRDSHPTFLSTDPYPSPFLLDNLELVVQRETSATSGPDRAEAVLTRLRYDYGWSSLLHRGTDRRSQIFGGPSSTDPKEDPKRTTIAPLAVWFTGLPRSRFPQQRIWSLPANGQVTDAQVSALAWRRHPHHPCIQVLPLTQTATPPNYPSPSRQLVPFDLPLRSSSITVHAENFPETIVVQLAEPQAWSFENAVGTRKVAAAWPIATHFTVSGAWKRLGHLPLAPLGLPGATLLPDAGGIDDPSKFLAGLQYRIDLPYLDETYALAELPRDFSPADATLLQTPPPPPAVLSRYDYASHWTELNDRGLLAAADAVDSLVDEGSDVFVTTLVEPLRWKVHVAADLSNYPGELKFVDAENGTALRLAGESRDTDALRGFDGGFRSDGNELNLFDTQTDPSKWDPSLPIRLVGGCFTATIESNGESQLRDQRGLLRSATREFTVDHSELPLRTPLQLKTGGALGTISSSRVELFSLREAVDVKVGPDAKWQFWFKALPMKHLDGQFSFVRQDAMSQPTGINDPGAMDREHGHLTAYEWLLADASGEDYLDLGAFRFYPLELESADIDQQGRLSGFKMLGRLQLVLFAGGPKPPNAWLSRELTNFDSAVYLNFVGGKLDSIVPASADPDVETTDETCLHCWPLADPTERPETPALVWKRMDFKYLGEDGPRVIIRDWRLEYTRHGLSWTLLPKVVATTANDDEVEGELKPLRIPLGANPPRVEFTDFDLSTVGESGGGDLARAAVRVTKVELTLDFPKKRHDVNIDWELSCGAAEQLQLKVSLKDRIFPLDELSNDDRIAKLIHHPTGGTPKEVLLLADWRQTPLEIIDRNALQVVWTGVDPAQLPGLQLLPGFGLAETPEAVRGFAIFTFVLETAPPSSPDAPPAIEPRLLGAYQDALFHCDWGDSLLEHFGKLSDEELPQEERPAATRAALASTAGQVVAEYTVRYSPDEATDWKTSLMLSGLLEIKNLVSWPRGLSADSRFKISVPPAKSAFEGKGLNHWRHTIRVVLSEHEIGGQLLEGGSSEACLLNLRQGAAWTFPAVVEHQLLAIDLQRPTGSKLPGDPVVEVTAAQRERRWTCAQQVRMISPRAMFDFLATMAQHNSVDALAFREDWPIEHFEDAFQGLTRESLRKTLGIPPQLPQDPNQVKAAFQASALGKNFGEALLFEAGVPLFIRKTPIESTPGTDLLNLPRGIVRGGLANVSDYWSTFNSNDEMHWLFTCVPFLGRSQVAEPIDGKPLKTDPVLAAANAIEQGGDFPELCRTFANWAHQKSINLQTTQFDSAEPSWFRRLDPSSQREAWHRLNLIRAANGDSPDGNSTDAPQKLPNILHAGASDSSALLTRPTSLGPLFDARRMSLPPGRLPQPTSTITFDTIVWSRESLKTMLAAILRSGGDDHPYAFLAFPLLLAGSGLLEGKELQRRHPAATLLPPNAGEIKVPRFHPDGSPMLNPDGTPVLSKPRSTLQPVTLALSPFVSLRELRFNSNLATRPLLAVGELVGFDASGQVPTVIDSQLSHAEKSRIDFAAGFRQWGADCHARQAPDAKVAVVRLRILEAVLSNELPPKVVGLRQRYEFLPIDVPPDQRDLLTRAFALRTPPAQLRHAEGQFRGTAVPRPIRDKALPAYALAPPLVDGVQPIRLNERLLEPPAGVDNWPWGFAGLRLSTAYRRNSSTAPPTNCGVAGPRFGDTDKLTMWWQSLSQPIQFSNPAQRRLLPRLFRVPALPGYLPAWPRTPLPPTHELVRQLDKSQPILPGARHVLLTGSRPGAPFAFREFLASQLLTKADGKWSAIAHDVVQSASVPVQHRPPRPILIPPSKSAGQAVALRTWGSWFELDNEQERIHYPTLAVEPHPCDEAMLLLPGGSPSAALGGVRLVVAPNSAPQLLAAGIPQTDLDKLVDELSRIFPAAPTGGEVGRDWDGTIVVCRQTLGETQGPWNLTATCAIAQRSFSFVDTSATLQDPDANDFPMAHKHWAALKDCVLQRFAPEPNQLSELQRAVASLPHGGPIRVAVSVELVDPPPAAASTYEVKGYRQSLNLSLRANRLESPREVDDKPRDRRVFAPRFLQFEDPEYNRQLSSVPGKATADLPLDAANRTIFTLAVDRTEYNVNGVIHVTYDRGNASIITGDPNTEPGITGTIAILRRKPDGSLSQLGKLSVSENTLSVIKLTELADADQRIEPEDYLVLRLVPDNIPKDPTNLVDLAVAIVARPVTPVPQAAYALLKLVSKAGRVDHVECARFAWSADPGRIELVCPDDLKAEIVRRRAVFQFQDTVRNHQDLGACRYAIQKITTFGSTHFPTQDEMVPRIGSDTSPL